MPECVACGASNPDGARFCNACGSPLVPRETSGGEERKTVTVVFVDLVGFTARSERLDPEDVRALLAPYHARVRSELERFGGTVEKFIGDAVMAVFGAPVSHEDDAERAVRAALAIRDWAAAEGSLQVRVAANTGEALVTMGARPAEGEAMVAGDVVNTAARLQAAAPVDGVLVGEATYRATRDLIAYRERQPVSAKGKAEPLQVWEALEAPAPPGRDRPARTPLVGRDRELELLVSLLARVREERSAQLVTLVGVPGIGKSRLIHELEAAAGELVTWRAGRCLPYGEGVTFWALGEIVKAEAGVAENDSGADAAGKLRAAVARLIPDEGEAPWIGRELGVLLGLSEDAAGAGEAAAAGWRRFVEALGERGPTVLVFEDLHWADDGLLDFVDELVEALPDVPLLIACTTRPELLERRQTWGGGKSNATTISLRPLDDEQTGRLLALLLDQRPGSADERRMVLERAGGNPLFAEQYVRMVAERGTAGGVPESVQAIIAARLDGLSRPEKELLQEAAVHGKTFWLGGVATSLDLSAPEAERLLRQLERKDFVRRERHSGEQRDRAYAFRHVLLRDVAYGQIPRRERAGKHERAAGWIEALGLEEAHAELLAHHLERAVEIARATGVPADTLPVERARDALAAAGARAFALGAYASAAEFYARALGYSTPDGPERAPLLLGRARALLPLGGSGRGLLEEAIRGFEARGDAEGAAQAATTAARFAWFEGDRASTDRLIAAAMAATARLPGSPARVEALAYQAGFHMLGGRFHEAIAAAQEGLSLAESAGLEYQRPRLHLVLGTARCCVGDVGGLEQIEASIGIAREAGELDMVVSGFDNLASELHYLGRLEEARAAWRQALDVGQRYGLGRHVRTQRAGAAAWAYIDGRYEEALAVADEIVSEIEAGATSYTDPMVVALRAKIRLDRGDRDGADRDSAWAVELARSSDAQAQAAAFSVRGAIALALGRRDEADAAATDALGLGPVLVPALTTGFPSLAAIAWLCRDLGRERDLAAVLDATPIPSPWLDAARAILAADDARAVRIIEAIGDRTSASHARARAAAA